MTATEGYKKATVKKRIAVEAYEKAVEAQKRLPELEPDIMQNAYISYLYTRDIIKCRWTEVEPNIMQDACDSYHYALDIIQRRWYEAEPIIMQDAIWAYLYARNVIKDRWLEAEEIIAKSINVNNYIKDFFDEPVITKDQVDTFVWDRKKLPGYFAPASMFEDKISLLDMVIK